MATVTKQSEVVATPSEDKAGFLRWKWLAFNFISGAKHSQIQFIHVYKPCWTLRVVYVSQIYPICLIKAENTKINRRRLQSSVSGFHETAGIQDGGPVRARRFSFAEIPLGFCKSLGQIIYSCLVLSTGQKMTKPKTRFQFLWVRIFLLPGRTESCGKPNIEKFCKPFHDFIFVVAFTFSFRLPSWVHGKRPGSRERFTGNIWGNTANSERKKCKFFL